MDGCRSLWVIVDSYGWLWMVVGSCGWLLVVVDDCGWLWVVAYFSITRSKITSLKMRNLCLRLLFY